MEEDEKVSIITNARTTYADGTYWGEVMRYRVLKPTKPLELYCEIGSLAKKARILRNPVTKTIYVINHNGDVFELENRRQLFVLLQYRLNLRALWKKGAGYVTKREIYKFLRMSSYLSSEVQA